MRIAFAALFLATALHAQPALFEPSLSPDGKTVVFVSGGDIWSAPSSGGAAHLLVAHPATESRPLFSPDGKSLAFVGYGSASGQWWRHGRSHMDETQLWLLEDMSGRKFRQLTGDGAKQIWPMWSRDGQHLYYMSDRSGNENIWTMSLAG